MTPTAPPRMLLIACGALAREVLALIRLNGWSHMELACLPAHLHNRPERIPAAVRAKIRAARPQYPRIIVLYGDCGTGGELDQVLAEEGVERVPGPHCYAFYSGLDAFLAQAEAEPACFYLTDYLARHFERLVIQGLGLDRHPELRDDYFGHYTRVLWLAQRPTPATRAAAERAAARLGLPLEVREVGDAGLEAQLAELLS